MAEWLAHWFPGDPGSDPGGVTGYLLTFAQANQTFLSSEVNELVPTLAGLKVLLGICWASEYYGGLPVAP